MRWEELFADLEAQLEAETAADLRSEVAERSRLELARITLADRASAHRGGQVQVGVLGAAAVQGRLLDVADGWLLVATERHREVLVPVLACQWLVGLGRAADRQGPAVVRRLGLTSALRSLARQRVTVRLVLTGGSELTGTIDRVLADHLDLAEHPGDSARRRDAVRVVRAVRLAALATVGPA